MKATKHILIFLFCVVFAGNLSAAHIVGGGITYECLGNSGNGKLYRFTMKVYRDCFSGGAAFDDPANIAIYNGSYQVNFLYTNFTVPLGTVVPIGIGEPDCIDNLPSLCVEEGTYTWETVLPVSNQSYFIEYQRCCRTNAIANILVPGETGATYFAEITPAAQQVCNDSPVFNNFPPVVICNNYPLEVDYSATDPDGDQLVYSFCAPYAGGGNITSGGGLTGCDGVIPTPPCPPPYEEVQFIAPDYSAAQPMGGNPVVSINAQTGVISGTPTMVGQYVVGVCVHEYRNGQLLSVTHRDFQFNVTPCAPQVTALVHYDELAGPQHYVIKQCSNSTTVTIINESFSLPNINNFLWTFDLNNGNVIQNSTDFNLTVNFPGFGTYNGTLILNQGLDCGDTAFIQVQLYPPATLNLGPDVTICNGGSVLLNAGPGFSAYHWQNGSTGQTLNATTSGLYYVAATDHCGNVLRDSVFVNISQVAEIDLSDINLCPGQSVTVTVPGFTQYQWSPGTGLSCTNCASVVVQPTVSTTYTLAATNAAGCHAEGSFHVTVLPTPMRTYVIQFYPNQSVTLGGQTYTQPGTVVLTVPSTTGGCDSLNTYILELIPTTLQIQCPANITVALPDNATGIPVNYAAPVTTTNCPGTAPVPQLQQGLPSGGNFPGGVTTVCYQAANTCNNTASCCFTVTVTSLDIQCPPNITVALPGNETTIPVNYAAPTATTDCPGSQPVIQLQQGLPSGGNFPGGVTEVCYGATNTCGNNASCCFTVTATSLDIQCPPNITVALPGNETTIPVNYAAPTATTDCPGSQPVIQLQQGLPSGGNFPGGVTEVCYGATNTCGNSESCCFTVTATSLDIQCPPNITVALPGNETTIPVNYAAPTATTDCPGSQPVIQLQQGLPSGGNFPGGVTEVCYGATNTCGNSESCCFTVTVTSLAIQCPANITVALPNNATTTAVNYSLPTATTDCPGSVPVIQLQQGIASGGAFPSGVNNVCYQATNTCGNQESCCFTVTVTTIDIQCPANITVALPNNATSAAVNYPLPTASTNCPGSVPDLQLLQGLPSGGNFPSGVTTVCYQATNTCGNAKSCCFTVTGTTLDIHCPANITVQMPVAAISVAVNYAAPTTTTNCPDPATTVTLLQGLASGGAFPLGVNKVCYEGSNTCGNRDTCCFNVTVTDPPPPCDIKVIGCMKFELLDIRLDSIDQRRFRIRATNFCPTELDYVAIQLPPGVVAVTPLEGSTYTAPNTGRQYKVRNPNASPFYSTRFRSAGTGMTNSQSDVFEYRLPQQSHTNHYIHIMGKLKNGEAFEAHLNTWYCPVQPWAGSKDEYGIRNEDAETDEPLEFQPSNTEFSIYPNPTEGMLYVDMSPWIEQSVKLQVLNAQGQLVLDRGYTVESDWLELNLDRKLASGLYYLVIQPAGGAKATARFVLER